jgi:hypothetical protein
MTCPICNDARVIHDSDGEGTGWINCFRCSETMGGTGLQNYLYGLGISHHAMAELADVRERTVRRWIDDYFQVPYDVHKLVTDLDDYITDGIRYLLLEHKGPVLRASNYFNAGEFREKLDAIHPLFKEEIKGPYFRTLICNSIDRRIDEFQRANGKFKGYTY